MKVYAAMFNPCVHESGFTVISLHQNLSTAQEAVDREMAHQRKQYRDNLPRWVQEKK